MTGRPSSTKLEPPKYFLEVAKLISKLYPSAKKIIEVGVGNSPYTALYLKAALPQAEIVVTDIDPAALRLAARLNINAFYDDINDPNLEIYEDADLIYSIRPPPELIPRMEDLGRRVGVEILIAPLSEDAYLSSLENRWKRVQSSSILIYVLKP